MIINSEPLPTIICVDDEKIVLDSLRMHLNETFEDQFNIEIAESSSEAIEIVDELMLNNETPMLIIADQIMPEMKGDELLQKIKQKSPKTMSILLTGQANKDDIINAINHADLYRYIAKPWDKEDLVLTIEQAVLSYNKTQKIEDQRDDLLHLNNLLERKVEYRTREVDHKTNQLAKKNKELSENIKYAKQIQEVLLPEFTQKKSPFEGFILFKPLNVISGDIYWYYEHGDLILYTVVDCTGHGVQGAFATIIVNNLLLNIIKFKKIYEPHLILKELNEAILNLMEKDNNQITTGLDISLIAINKKEKWVRFSGAMHSIAYIQNNKLNVINGDSVPIGGLQEVEREFEMHEIQISSPTQFYMFTDGYHGQYGGVRGKKFMAEKLYEKLLQVSNLSLKMQKVMLEETFNIWKGSYDQIDDVLLVGLKIN